MKLQKTVCFEGNIEKHAQLFCDSSPLVLANLFLPGALAWNLKDYVASITQILRGETG